MGRFLLILLMLGAGGTGAYYASIGRLPWTSVAPEEAEVSALKEELRLIRQQWKQAGRAGALGVDTSSVTDGPLTKLERLEKSLAEVIPRLKTSEARNQAVQLRRDLASFKSEMR
jgi:hypothetical protein